MHTPSIMCSKICLSFVAFLPLVIHSLNVSAEWTQLQIAWLGREWLHIANYTSSVHIEWALLVWPAPVVTAYIHIQYIALLHTTWKHCIPSIDIRIYNSNYTVVYSMVIVQPGNVRIIRQWDRLGAKKVLMWKFATFALRKVRLLCTRHTTYLI